MVARLMRIIAAISMTMTFLIGTGGSTWAQAPSPDVPGGSRGSQQVDPAQPYQNEDGVWMASENPHADPRTQAIQPHATGGLNGFGYTVVGVPLSWIDATGGTVLGMTGFSAGQRTGPIGLPFTFKFYENAYSSLYIAASGYLSFSDSPTWPSLQTIPTPAVPNNLIAPYATYFYLASSGSTNRVYYTSGGSPGSRYFVVEWYQVKFGDANYTFEAVLYENGTILFQYQGMNYTPYNVCGAAGIEDSTGTDGLAYNDYCQQIPSDAAVRFTRPAAAARYKLSPLAAGRFVRAAEIATIPLTLRNTGDLGVDEYDLAITSTWPVKIYASDHATQLADTDADGRIEVGSISQGGSAALLMDIQAPLLGNVGDSSFISITPTSSLGATGQPSIYQVAIPAPFAQVFTDNVNYAMSLSLIQPGKEDVYKASPDNEYGNNTTLAAKTDGYVYMWDVDSYFGSSSREKIYFTLLDKNGAVTRSKSMLTDNNAPPYYAYDFYPAVDVAPNGRIGVAWMRELYNNSTGLSQYNVYFTILDASGNLVVAPQNLTNNTTWGTDNDLNIPRYFDPRLTATGDNRFMVAWQRRHKTIPDNYVQDLYYVVKDTNGGTIKPLFQYTHGTPGGGQWYEAPALTPLSNNRMLMAWTQHENYTFSVAYTVFDSNGNPTQPTALVNMYSWRVDAVQLSTGNILIAGRDLGGVIKYAVLDGNTFAEITTNVQLTNPFSSTGDGYISVTADSAGHGILTWMEEDYLSRKNIYYALVGSDGAVITAPMILRASQQAALPTIETSFFGYGNAVNKAVVPTYPGTDLRIKASEVAGGPPGGVATIPVWVSNNGATKGTGVVVTAILDTNLTYIGANPAPSSVMGSEIAWYLPDLSYLGSGQISLTVSLPSTTIGTLHPVTWNAASTGPEANPADNSATTNVMESIQAFLPLIRR